MLTISNQSFNMLLPKLHSEIIGDKRSSAAVIQENPAQRRSDPHVPENLAAGHMHHARNAAQNTALRPFAAASRTEATVRVNLTAL
jgi:hypothetical protein